MPPLAAPPDGIAVDFPQNSAQLDDPALAEVKLLAAARGDGGIAITGFGGATSSDAVVQSDGLRLGLSRAQALATALVAQGVPNAMLRLNAEAAGRGATLRLLQ
jgi:outer membrane protein OmpA-like peptidoglycan-associated protein